jgi:RloB-like protein
MPMTSRRPAERRGRRAGYDTRTNLSRRSSGSRKERRSFLILCEGKTEKLYFTGMRTRYGPQINADVPGCDHLGVVKEAIKRRTAEYDEVWCVLDTELDSALVAQLRQTADGTGVELALSTPCFELWLILRHEDRTAPYQAAEKVKRHLTRLLPGWTEADTRFADFRDGVAEACRRARGLERTGDEHLKNPSTTVWRLVEKIAEPSTG